MSDELLRVYFDPAEIGSDGYPYVWHQESTATEQNGPPNDGPILNLAVKDYIRDLAGNRCERCLHPYEKGMGEWSPCDELCTHGEPRRTLIVENEVATIRVTGPPVEGVRVEAQWRILTVHHLNGIKHDCRWWNLAALCQRCHLTIQAKVHLDRPYDRPHTEWFRPHAAGYYASTIRMLDNGEEPSREWVMGHIDEILHEHAIQGTLL